MGEYFDLDGEITTLVKTNVLFFDDDYNISMYSSYGTKHFLKELLDLDEDEKKSVEEYEKNGYTLICVKEINNDYPDYFKIFMQEYTGENGKNKTVQVSNEPEIRLPRSNNHTKELVFIKLILPEDTAFTESIEYTRTNFSDTIQDILSNLALTQ